jgi:hypothetical protein
MVKSSIIAFGLLFGLADDASNRGEMAPEAGGNLQTLRCQT